MVRLLDRLLSRLQSACSHDSDLVTADVLEGDFHGGPGGEQAMEWCYRCGAYRRVFDQWARYGEWHRPNAVWARERAELNRAGD